MIRVVADTHALVWFLFDDARLTARARESMLVAPGDIVAISAITLVELVYLEEKGKLASGTTAAVELAVTGDTSPLQVVPVGVSIVAALRRVPRGDVPDMPDRIIAATAVALAVPVVSRDRRIRTAAVVDTIW